MTFLDDVAEERARQIEELGYDAAHDDQHAGAELAMAGVTYAYPIEERPGPESGPHVWPFASEFWSPTPEGRRRELVKAAAFLAAEADRLDRAGLPPQAYLPKGYCWQGRPVQVAASIRDEVMAFLHRHPRLKAFSGLRPGSGGDHRCGYALDMVPVSFDDRRSVDQAYADATHAGYAYVEPLSATWIPGNHHLHVSFVRCP